MPRIVKSPPPPRGAKSTSKPVSCPFSSGSKRAGRGDAGSAAAPVRWGFGCRSAHGRDNPATGRPRRRRQATSSICALLSLRQNGDNEIRRPATITVRASGINHRWCRRTCGVVTSALTRRAAGGGHGRPRRIGRLVRGCGEQWCRDTSARAPGGLPGRQPARGEWGGVESSPAAKRGRSCHFHRAGDVPTTTPVTGNPSRRYMIPAPICAAVTRTRSQVAKSRHSKALLVGARAKRWAPPKSREPSKLSDSLMASFGQGDLIVCCNITVFWVLTIGRGRAEAPHFGAIQSRRPNEISATVPTPPSHSAANHNRRFARGRRSG